MTRTTLALTVAVLPLAAFAAVASGFGHQPPEADVECSLFLAVLEKEQKSSRNHRTGLTDRSMGGWVDCDDSAHPLEGTVVFTYTSELGENPGRQQRSFEGDFEGELRVVETGLNLWVTGEVAGEITEGIVVSETLRGHWRTEQIETTLTGQFAVQLHPWPEGEPETLGGVGFLAIADPQQERGTASLVCDGTGNVTVGRGETCEFADTDIRGNVRVREGGRLILLRAGVGGNVRTGQGAEIEIIDSRISGNLRGSGMANASLVSSMVEGNVHFAKGGKIVLWGSTIDGNLRLDAMSRVSMQGNIIDGNTRLEHIRLAEVSNNSVDGNLHCRNNSRISGTGNRVSGNSRGQCSTS